MHSVVNRSCAFQYESQSQLEVPAQEQSNLHVQLDLINFASNNSANWLASDQLKSERSIKILELFKEDPDELDVDEELAVQIDAQIRKKLISNFSGPFTDTDLVIFNDSTPISAINGLSESEYVKACAIYDRIVSNDTCFIPTDEIKDQFLDAIRKLLTRNVGRELVYNIVDHKQPIKIIWGLRPGVFSKDIVMSRKPTWIIEQRPNGQMRLRELPFFLTLGHELFHVLHKLNDEHAGFGKPTEHRDYHCLEEQFTITGWKEEFNESFSNYHHLNERSLTAAFSSKESYWFPRFGHEGHEGFMEGIDAIQFLVKQKLLLDLDKEFALAEISKLLKDPAGKKVFSLAVFDAETITFFLDRNLVDSEGNSVLKYIEKSGYVDTVLEHLENEKISQSHREMISTTLRPTIQTMFHDILDVTLLADEEISLLTENFESLADWFREMADAHIKFKDLLEQELQKYKLIFSSEIQILRQHLTSNLAMESTDSTLEKI